MFYRWFPASKIKVWKELICKQFWKLYTRATNQWNLLDNCGSRNDNKIWAGEGVQVLTERTPIMNANADAIKHTWSRGRGRGASNASTSTRAAARVRPEVEQPLEAVHVSLQVVGESLVTRRAEWRTQQQRSKAYCQLLSVHLVHFGALRDALQVVQQEDHRILFSVHTQTLDSLQLQLTLCN